MSLSFQSRGFGVQLPQVTQNIGALLISQHLYSSTIPSVNNLLGIFGSFFRSAFVCVVLIDNTLRGLDHSGALKWAWSNNACARCVLAVMSTY
jgi:hypothetical protein